jgi:hypothetical protein
VKLGLDIAPDVGVNKRSRSVAQPGSASGLGPEGREFESLHSDHFFKVLIGGKQFLPFVFIASFAACFSLYF